jgi:hypothetical protein
MGSKSAYSRVISLRAEKSEFYMAWADWLSVADRYNMTATCANSPPELGHFLVNLLLRKENLADIIVGVVSRAASDARHFECSRQHRCQDNFAGTSQMVKGRVTNQLTRGHLPSRRAELQGLANRVKHHPRV